jgi:hypothetical protein
MARTRIQSRHIKKPPHWSGLYMPQKVGHFLGHFLCLPDYWAANTSSNLAARYRSASSAAIQPVPAAVMA